MNRILFYTLLFSLANLQWLPGAELTSDQLFARDHVVNVEVEISAADWRKLCDQSRTNPFGDPSDKPFSYFKAKITIDGTTIDNVGIRKKGFIGSLDSFRPSLKVKFDKYQEQQPVEKMITMTLNNNKQDRALLSQSLTYHLFRKAGVHAPRTSMATVTVNGEYLGIYTHVESMKEPFLEREYGDASGEFYEGTLSDFYPKALGRLEAKNATSTKDRVGALKLAELIEKDQPVDLDALGHVLDIDNFLRFWAMESLLGFWDGYTQNQNNFFAYQNPKDGKFYFMPWGADSCFGDNPFRRGDGAASITANSMLSNRLFYTDGIQDRYNATLRKLLDEVWNEKEIIAECDRIFALILDEFDEQQFLDAHNAKDRMIEFVKGRRAKIEAELKDDWPPSVAGEPRIPIYFEQVGTATGDFAAVWDSREDKQVAASQVELGGSKQKFTSIDIETNLAPQRRFGFGGRSNAKPPLAIVLSCKRDDDEPLTLTLNVKQEDLVDIKKGTVRVSGKVQDGYSDEYGRSPWGRGPQLQGTMKVTKSPIQDGELKSGQPIAGEFDLKIVEMRGGRRW